MQITLSAPSPCFGVAWIDAAHDALAGAMARLSAAPDEEFACHFEQLVLAVEDDFRSEERAMEAMSFAGLKSHREAHARALAALHQTEAQVAAGAVPAGRRTLAALAEWFTLHQATMDLALTDAMKAAARASSWPQLPQAGCLVRAPTPV